MNTRRIVTSFATLAALALPGAALQAQQRDDKPLTIEQVGKTTEKESKRVANQTGKATRKAAKQTEKQAKRTARSVKKVYSRKARREDTAQASGNRSYNRSARAAAVAQGPRN